MPLPTLTTLALALLGRPPAPEESGPAALRRTLTGAALPPGVRTDALRGLDSMAIRHPARLAKITEAAARDAVHMQRAALVLAEYARTRRPA